MLIYHPTLPMSRRTEVDGAVQLIGTRLSATTGTDLPKSLRRDLQELLAGRETEPTMAIPPYAVIAYDARTNGPWGYAGGACVWLTERAFDARKGRLAAVLLHELVHVLCGRELDSEISEFSCFRGASTLDEGDITIFRQTNWRGRWFRLMKTRGDGKPVARHDGGDIDLSSNPVIQAHVSELPTE